MGVSGSFPKCCFGQRTPSLLGRAHFWVASRQPNMRLKLAGGRTATSFAHRCQMTLSDEVPTVAAILSEVGMRDRLRQALSHRARLLLASSWGELVGIVQDRSVSIVLADPLASGMGAPAKSVEYLRSGVGIPLVLY